jgi:RND family efflux transporter MFP subunit
MKPALTRWIAAALSLAGAFATQAEPLDTVTTEIRQLPREFRLDGVVEATNRTTVSAQTSGQVQEILYDVDDFVEKDAVLVRLKDTEQQAHVVRAAADLKEAVARLQEARDEHQRTNEVFAKKLVSASAMDKAEAALKSAQARYQAAEAGLSQAREQLDYTAVRAPYSGIVTERLIEVGEVAQPGKPLMSGLSLEQLRVTVDVPQSLVPRIREFRRARIERGDGSSVQASRITIFPIADRASNTFKVRVELPEGTAELFPGMFVKTAFTTGMSEELLVPRETVVYRSEVTGVYVVDGGGEVRLRHVRLGRKADGHISVLAGLTPGETIARDPIAAGVELKRRLAESRHE